MYYNNYYYVFSLLFISPGILSPVDARLSRAGMTGVSYSFAHLCDNCSYVVLFFSGSTVIIVSVFQQRGGGIITAMCVHKMCPNSQYL